MMNRDDFDEQAEALFERLQARGQGVIGEPQPWIDGIAAALRDAYDRGRDHEEPPQPPNEHDAKIKAIFDKARAEGEKRIAERAARAAEEASPR